MFQICVCSQCVTKTTTGTNGKTIPGQWLLLYFLVWLGIICGVSQANLFQQLPPGPNFYLCSPKDIPTITKQLRLDSKLDTFAIHAASPCMNLKMHQYPVHIENQRDLLSVKKLSSLADPVLSPCSNPRHTLLGLALHSIHLPLAWYTICKNEIDFWKEKAKSTLSSDIVDIHQSRAWKSFSVRADRQLFRNEI
ncbi:hypothetical protein VP01_5329g1 [Puccinia sorghi]|uniref:Uncharacterized protein n=1 Tax=Puccinia sorghi TaxID=27349 RepID=A0A0L6UK51_9BASI|nr:hypothetical protein VP01_5329g1 [Puccinia sorghi]